MLMYDTQKEPVRGLVLIAFLLLYGPGVEMVLGTSTTPVTRAHEPLHPVHPAGVNNEGIIMESFHRSRTAGVGDGPCRFASRGSQVGTCLLGHSPVSRLLGP
jgi:hypothetical protein